MIIGNIKNNFKYSNINYKNIEYDYIVNQFRILILSLKYHSLNNNYIYNKLQNFNSNKNNNTIFIFVILDLNINKYYLELQLNSIYYKYKIININKDKDILLYLNIINKLNSNSYYNFNPNLKYNNQTTKGKSVFLSLLGVNKVQNESINTIVTELNTINNYNSNHNIRYTDKVKSIKRIISIRELLNKVIL
ncbi:hypothetical protein NEOKW01_1116 [Nematocida sp. AWRm80]|nr:hypothetical protein NEOKW01_1116 [Nematocida sp. AWRm80]